MSLKLRNISIYSLRESFVKLRKTVWNLLTKN